MVWRWVSTVGRLTVLGGSVAVALLFASSLGFLITAPLPPASSGRGVPNPLMAEGTDSFQTMELPIDPISGPQSHFLGQLLSDQPSTSGPSPRLDHRMAYDAESDRVVLFGGQDPPLRVFNDETWAYDFETNTWTLQQPAVSPAPRWGHGMDYDPVRDRVVLFAGDQAHTSTGILRMYNDTWTYNLNANAWIQESSPMRPPFRSGPAAAFDIESDFLVTFGGQDETLGFNRFEDTWAYNFTSGNWTNMNPPVHPSARTRSAMTYDSESDRLILFGGDLDSGASDETWAYDSNTNSWTNANPNARPSSRFFHAMAYDAESDRIILFGGNVGGGETWAYDYNTNTWTNMAPANAPASRSRLAMAYDSDSDRVILFGGSSGSDETWAYDYNTNVWVDLSPATVPTAPLGLQAAASDALVNLTWGHPADDGRSPITGYRISGGTVSGSLSLLAEIGAVLTYAHTDLVNGQTYYYEVRALNGVGEGPPSEEVAATPTAPPDTTNPTVTILSPIDGSSLSSISVTVSGTASDDMALERVELSTDEANWVIATGLTSWTSSLTLEEGENTVFARATDTSANAATVSISLTVRTSPPDFPIWLIVASIGATVAAITAVSVYFVRRK